MLSFHGTSPFSVVVDAMIIVNFLSLTGYVYRIIWVIRKLERFLHGFPFRAGGLVMNIEAFCPQHFHGPASPFCRTILRGRSFIITLKTSHQHNVARARYVKATGRFLPRK